MASAPLWLLPLGFRPFNALYDQVRSRGAPPGPLRPSQA